jgi:nucleoside-diphosphate-sugar epimerase
VKSDILVVGGAGYLGARLVPALLEQGHSVVVSDLLWFGNPFKGIEVLRRNVFDLEVSFLKRFDQVIFLAGFSNDAMAKNEPSLCYAQNTAAPTYLAYTAKLAGIRRFIYAESCAVYGHSEVPMAEDCPTNANSIYAKSKLLGGIASGSFADDTFSVARLRLGTICGYSPRMRFDILLNAMYGTSISQGKMFVSNSSIWRPLLAIVDAVSAFVHFASSDQAFNGIFNIHTDNVTVGEVAKHVARFFELHHDKRLEIVESCQAGIPSYRACGKKVARLLGFKPIGSIEACLHELDRCLPSNCNCEDDIFFNAKAFQRIYLSLAGQ